MKNIVLNCAGKTLDLSKPVVMGIINATPDSFFEESRQVTLSGQLRLAEEMISAGATILDIGAASTRPGAKKVTEREERRRLEPAIKAISGHFPDCIISADTFHSSVASMAVEHGAGIINDVYGGRFDPEIMNVAAKAKAPFVIMHMQGSPADMQINPHYKDVLKEVVAFFKERIAALPQGYDQIILDPGFGFGKSVEHNFSLLKHLEDIIALGYPVLAGLSRKSMINRTLHIKPGQALNGTTVLNTVALLKGASILRVHDVKEAVEAIRLIEALDGSQP